MGKGSSGGGGGAASVEQVSPGRPNVLGLYTDPSQSGYQTNAGGYAGLMPLLLNAVAYHMQQHPRPESQLGAMFPGENIGSHLGAQGGYMPQFSELGQRQIQNQNEGFAMQSPHMTPRPTAPMQSSYFPIFGSPGLTPVTRTPYYSHPFESLLGSSVQQNPSYPYSVPDFGSQRSNF